METEKSPAPARSGQGGGNGSGHVELPTPKKRKSGNVKKGWIEFRSKNGKRYARRRRWVLKDDGWVKKYIGREHAIPVMTEKQYVNYKRDKARAKQIKQTKHRTRSGSD